MSIVAIQKADAIVLHLSDSVISSSQGHEILQEAQKEKGIRTRFEDKEYIINPKLERILRDARETKPKWFVNDSIVAPYSVTAMLGFFYNKITPTQICEYIQAFDRAVQSFDPLPYLANMPYRISILINDIYTATRDPVRIRIRHSCKENEKDFRLYDFLHELFHELEDCRPGEELMPKTGNHTLDAMLAEREYHMAEVFAMKIATEHPAIAQRYRPFVEYLEELSRDWKVLLMYPRTGSFEDLDSPTHRYRAPNDTKSIFITQPEKVVCQ